MKLALLALGACAACAGLAAGAREAWDTLRVTGLTSASGVFAVRTGDGTRRDTTINSRPRSPTW